MESRRIESRRMYQGHGEQAKYSLLDVIAWSTNSFYSIDLSLNVYSTKGGEHYTDWGTLENHSQAETYSVYPAMFLIIHSRLFAEQIDYRDNVLLENVILLTSGCIPCACGYWQHILWVLAVSKDLTLDASLGISCLCTYGICMIGYIKPWPGRGIMFHFWDPPQMGIPACVI